MADKNPFADPNYGMDLGQPAEANPFSDPNYGKPSSLTRRALGDGGISLLKGAIAVPEAAVGLADMVTGGRVGKAVEGIGFRPQEAKQILDSYLTPEQQQANRNVQQAKGFVDTLGAVVDNPSTIPHAVAESLPLMGAGGVIGRGIAAVAPKVSPLLAGAIGEGATMAGSAAEQIRQQTDDGLLTPKQSLAAAGAGVAGAALGAAGAKVGKAMGLGDVDTALVNGTLGTSTRSMPVRIGGNAVSEGLLEEMPQSAAEQVLQNYALDKDLGEGVGNASAMGLVTGGAMGGAFGAISGRRQAERGATDQPAVDTTLNEPPPLVVNRGADSADLIQPAPTADNPVPAPVERPDPSNGPLSAAASMLPSAAPTAQAQPAPASPEEARILAAIADVEHRAKLGGMTPVLAAERARLGGELVKLQQPATDPGQPLPALDDQRSDFYAGRDGFTSRQRDPWVNPANNRSSDPYDRFPGIDQTPPQTLEGELLTESKAVPQQYRAGGMTPVRDPLTGDLMGGDLQAQQDRQRLSREGDIIDGEVLPPKAMRALSTSFKTEAAASRAMKALPAPERFTVEQQGDTYGIRQMPAPAPSIIGREIDGEWSAFAPESGTLAVPRAEMPQIKAEHRGAMVNFLNARGIQHEEQTVPAASLKPTQAEFSREKVDRAKAFTGGDRSILVSSDGHVLDGHHQWLAKRGSGADVKVIRLKAPIRELLDTVAEFPSATQEAGVKPAGIGRQPKTPQRGQRRSVDRDRDSVVQAAIRLGGITNQWKQDTTGDTRGNKNIPGIGALWSDNTGTSIDDMASLLDQHGYVPAGEMGKDGGVSWLQSAIRDEIGGRPHYAPESARQIEMAEQELLNRYAEAVARAIDEREAEYARIEAEYGPDAAADARSFDEAMTAHSEQLDGAIEDAREQQETVADGELATEADAARRDDELWQADSREGRPAGEDAGETFQLQQQTEAGLAEQARQQQAREQAEAETQRKADEKARNEAERAAAKQQNEAANAEFQLGQDAEQNLSGQRGIFDDAPAAAQREAALNGQSNTQPAAPTNWRTNFIQARQYAKVLGVPVEQGQKLADVVEAIDTTLARTELEQLTVEAQRRMAEDAAAAGEGVALSGAEVDYLTPAEKARRHELIQSLKVPDSVEQARERVQARIKARKERAEQKANSDTRYRLEGEEGGRLQADQVAEVLAASPELSGIRVVQSFEDLPELVRMIASMSGVDGRSMRGVYNKHLGATYVVANNHQSVADAVYTAVHEEVGHRGIHGLLGDRLNATMERIYASEMASVKGRRRIAQISELYSPILSRKSAAERRLLITEEIVAYLAESGDRPGVLQRFVSKVRAMLRRLFPQVRWTYNDILELIEQSRKWLQREAGKEEKIEGSQRYSRRGWDETFPDVELAHPLSFLNSHPDYAAAKAGDDAAALRVARDAVTTEFVERVRAMIPEGSRPRIVPVLAREGVGDNRIPLAAAKVLAKQLGLQVDTGPIQAEKVGRTQSKALERIANQPTFDGDVAAGDYLIIDDTLTQGGTLAQLKTHVEDNGGRVLGAVALTGKNYSRKLAIDPTTLAEIRGKYGEIEPWWRDSFGYGFEGLTQSEARTLLTFDKGRLSPDEIRDRLAAAKFRGLGQVDGRAAGDRSGTEAPVNPDDTRYSLADEADTRETLRKLGLIGDDATGLIERIRNLTLADLKTKLAEWGTRSREGLLDGLDGIRRAEEAVGVTEADRQGYVSARMASGIADVMHGVLHYAAPEWRDGVIAGKAGTRGVLEILGDLGPGNLTPWLAWLGGKRGQLLKAEGRENNLTDTDIAELLAMADGKESLFERVYRDYAQVNEAVLDLAEQAGLIDADARAKWATEYYVPFYRQQESDEGLFSAPRTKRGLSHQTAAIKALKGGKLPTNDLLANMLAGWTKRIDASMKNKALLEVVDNLKGSDYLADESPRYQQVLISRSQIAAQIRQDRKAQRLAAQMLGLKDGASAMKVVNELMKPQNDGFEKLWTRVAPTDPDIVRVQRAGKNEYYRVADESLLRGLKFMAGSTFNDPITRVGRTFKRILTTGVTSSPEFILRNFIRDAAHSWMISKDGFTLGKDSFKGIRDALREDQDYRDLMFAGGSFQGGYVHATDPEASAQIIRRALEKKGFTREQREAYLGSLVDTPAKAAAMLKQGWEKYRELGDKVENSNRLATYKAALAAGKSKRQAAFEAKDLMDFSLRGNFAAAQWFTDVVPFLNARLQGLYKLGRAMKGDRALLAREVAMKGAYIALFSLLLAGLNDDDERYQELQDWDKDANWHIFLGDEHFRIPKPFELGLIFGTLPERLLHAVTGTQKGEDLAKAVAHGVFQTLAFNPVPQFYQPIRELQANRNFFFDRPIEDMSDEGKLPQARYDERTSALSRVLGQLTGPVAGLSPKQLDHLVMGYTGTLGGYVLSMSSLIAGALGDASRPAITAGDIPVVKAVYQGDAVRSTQYQTKFYDMMQEAEQLHRTVKVYREEGKLDAADALLAENRDKLRHRPALGLARQQLGRIRQQMDRVYRDTSLGGEVKRERLDELQRRANGIAERVTRLAGDDF